MDTLDLYTALHRQSFVAHAAAEMEIDESTVKKDVGRLLLKLEELQDQNIQAMLEPRQTAYAMTGGEGGRPGAYLRSSLVGANRR